MNIALIIVLVVLIVFMMVSSTMRNKKENEKRMAMLNELKPGTKVTTISGVYGKIVSMEETTDGKIVLIETGKNTKKSYMEVHINAISAIDNKQLVVLDENGNDITPIPSEEEKVEEVKTEEKKAEETSSENVTTEEVKEEKKKKTSKKLR